MLSCIAMDLWSQCLQMTTHLSMKVPRCTSTTTAPSRFIQVPKQSESFTKLISYCDSNIKWTNRWWDKGEVRIQHRERRWLGLLWRRNSCKQIYISTNWWQLTRIGYIFISYHRMKCALPSSHTIQRRASTWGPATHWETSALLEMVRKTPETCSITWPIECFTQTFR